MSQTIYRYRQLLLVMVLIAAVFAAYFKIFSAEFVYDDFGFIVNNKAIQSFTPFSKFFTDPNIFTGTNYAAETGGENWRPIASLMFAAEYALFGANPAGFHFISIFLHILNLILVYILLTKLTERKVIVVLTTAFWALHPTATEAVSWVANQSSLIFLGFFLLTVLTILGYQKNRNNKLLIFLSYSFFALALLTKETALGGVFIIPFVFLLGYECREKVNFRKILTDSFPFFLIGLVYFYVHYKILGVLGDHALRGSFFQNFLLAPTVFFKYINLAVYPVNLLLDYTNFLLPSGIGDLRAIMGFLFAVILMALLYFGLKKSWFNFSFGIVWFMAFLSPVLQIIPFHDIVGERFLYAPLIGFFLALTLGFDRWNLRLVGKIILMLVLGLFSILTYNRNNDWLNSENLWNSVLKVDSKNEKALTNLGGYYIDKGLASKAIEVSEKLLQINENSAFGNINFGVGLAMAGRLKEAESHFLYILSKKPDYQPALVNLAAIYQNTGRHDEALEILRKLNQRSYIEEEFLAPAVEGNIVNSGIMGKAILINGKPFEASIDVFKDDDFSKPFISVRTHDDGTFQIPLRPGSYILKPIDPDGPVAPTKESYDFTIGDGRWLQVRVEYNSSINE